MKKLKVTVEFEIETDSNNDLIEKITEHAIKSLSSEISKIEVRVYPK